MKKHLPWYQIGPKGLDRTCAFSPLANLTFALFNVWPTRPKLHDILDF